MWAALLRAKLEITCGKAADCLAQSRQMTSAFCRDYFAKRDDFGQRPRSLAVKPQNGFQPLGLFTPTDFRL